VSAARENDLLQGNWRCLSGLCLDHRHVGQVFLPSVRTPVKTPYAAPNSVEDPAALPTKIGQYPSALPHLDTVNVQIGQLLPAQGAAQQQGQNRVVPLPFDLGAVRDGEEFRVCYGTRQLQPLRYLIFALVRADRVLLRSVFMERLRQVGGSEDICHPFEVVGHHCKTQLGTSTRFPT
jgi:hypothetical protein